MKILRQTSLCNGLVNLSIVQGSLLHETTDVIVNPANTYLDHHEGLAGSIAEAGGQVIQDESDALLKKFGRPIPVGNCVFTSAGALPFKKIIHTVGPMWLDGDKGSFDKPVQLRKCVMNSVEIAGLLGLKSIAMPAISIGLGGFPIGLCAQI